MLSSLLDVPDMSWHSLQMGARRADLDALQTRIEALDAWNWEQRVTTTLDRLHLDGERRIGDLSGGMKKRVALAQALVAVPDDGPTADASASCGDESAGAGRFVSRGARVAWSYCHGGTRHSSRSERARAGGSRAPRS